MQPGAAVVSVAAGVPMASIEAALGAGRPVIRAMPNLAMVVGESATALCANAHVSKEQMALAESIFGAVGSVARVEEPQMHAVTGLSGSGPAYVCLLIEALAAGGVNRGLRPEVAQALACQTLLGAAKLLREKGLHPAALRDRVTTPRGHDDRRPAPTGAARSPRRTDGGRRSGGAAVAGTGQARLMRRDSEVRVER